MSKPACECSEPGFCKRHKCEKNITLWKLCHEPGPHQQAFWDQFESGMAPQQLSHVNTDCIYRGDTVRFVDCEGCQGKKVLLKVLSCKTHGECSLAKVEGVHNCYQCKDRRSSQTEPIILSNHQCPGDIAVMTAAVRALHEAHPGKFLTDVRTSCPALWENNPYLTKIDNGTGRHIKCTYNGVMQCNQRPNHFLQAFCDDLANNLNVSHFYPKDWREPSIFLSQVEKGWIPQVEGDFWIVNAGIKSDYTAKKWNGYQEVIDRTKDQINWVQIGEAHHDHPKLRGVANLRGQTDLRQLVRLVYHARGVLCGVTALMHLAHWIEKKDGRFRNAVVIAGGREPTHWFAYPGHVVFSSVGTLDCCRQSGCWKSRVVKLNDGDEKDNSLCDNPEGDVGLCMIRINPEKVSQEILDRQPISISSMGWETRQISAG